MSLIHEALEKLEREKGGKEIPLPAEELGPQSFFPPPRPEKIKAHSKPSSGLIFGMTGALILLFISGLAYLFVQNLQKGVPPERPFSAVSSTANSSGQFSLTGITSVGEDATAIINNQFVRQGEEIAGATVLEIRDEDVVLDWDGENIILHL
jgi:hypothetical protein